ncbi:hypothetical protein DFQ30_010502 [Apophysomyces sp. BC1015]|nr:hypothetical protein DFQ30_010502 [Apophysomyces sp. BC1015]
MDGEDGYQREIRWKDQLALDEKNLSEAQTQQSMSHHGSILATDSPAATPTSEPKTRSLSISTTNRRAQDHMDPFSVHRFGLNRADDASDREVLVEEH